MLNLSRTSKGNSQRGAGGNNPQFQGKINASTGANINLGNQVYYGGLNYQEALRTFKSRRINVLLKEISERIRRWKDSLLKKINAKNLGDSAHEALVDDHTVTVTVTLLALQSAAPEDEEDCTSDRILSKGEFLEGLMPELKALVLNNNQA